MPCRNAFNRRRFLRRGLAATATFLACPEIVPSSVLGDNGATSPSNRIALGLIGVGMVGQGHLRGFLQAAEAQVAAEREQAATVKDLGSVRTDEPNPVADALNTGAAEEIL